MLAPNVLSEIERRALEIAAIFDAKDGKRRAEIAPCPANWHIVTTMPGKENKTAGLLADIAFGVFVPKFDPGSVLEFETKLPNGKPKIEKVPVGNRLIFPGRIFVFVWDLLDHWRRIKRTHGVQSILVDGADRPVVVPDQEINKIQVLQFSLHPKEKKRRKRYGSTQDQHVIVEYPRSYWPVDGAQRNRLLDQSLGLAS